MIRKLASGQYRLYSRKLDPKTGKRRNLGTFDSREQAEKHEPRSPVLQATLSGRVSPGADAAAARAHSLRSPHRPSMPGPASLS